MAAVDQLEILLNKRFHDDVRVLKFDGDKTDIARILFHKVIDLSREIGGDGQIDHRFLLEKPPVDRSQHRGVQTVDAGDGEPCPAVIAVHIH